MGASLALFGNDRVTGSRASGAGPDVAFEPAYPELTAPGGYGGDRIAIATGTDCGSCRMGRFRGRRGSRSPARPSRLRRDDDRPLRRDRRRDDLGDRLLRVDRDAAGNGRPRHRPPVVRVATVRSARAGSRRRSASRETGPARSRSIDRQPALQQASARSPGSRAWSPSPRRPANRLVAVADDGPGGARLATPTRFSTSGSPDRPTGMDLVDGSQFGWGNQDTLPGAHPLRGADDQQVEAVPGPADGTMTPLRHLPDARPGQRRPLGPTEQHGPRPGADHRRRADDLRRRAAHGTPSSRMRRFRSTPAPGRSTSSRSRRPRSAARARLRATGDARDRGHGESRVRLAAARGRSPAR